ncbi:S-layer homology domain-containing protein [Heliorestis acidaminivorans]|uniref:S-layer homology domain-containing protein n=1 Tax=Heliorestis acidaminivorans TaxID=553427 RepID=A0A6I0EZ88_9FIRM|nr:YcdB/YcdC domain-containing protein [Heliorestis acidaminivorans]KAB2951173.1 S-layer homology domain-containing protein [Heliorestis acidaminivorans]
MRKKIFSFLACSVSVGLLLSITPSGAALAIERALPAQTMIEESASSSSEDIDLEKSQSHSLEGAIQAAKKILEIPEEYSEFSYSFEKSNNREVWALNWSQQESGKGSIHVNMDSNSNQLLRIYRWSPYEEGSQSTLTQQQAQQQAAQFLQKVAPNYVSQLKLEASEEDAFPWLEISHQKSYHFSWQRLKSGIPVSHDGVRITVDGEKGWIESYELTWTETEMPSANDAVSMQKAREIFSEAGLLELQYQQPARFRPLSSGEVGEVQLVYRLTHPSFGKIDAITGQPFLPTSEDYYEKGAGMIGLDEGLRKGPEMAQDQSSYTLTPQELEKIQKQANLLTQDKAIEALKKWFDLPSTYTLREAGLIPLENSYVWNFYWITADGKGEYISATVQAEKGEVLNYYRTIYHEKELGEEQNKTVEESQKIAEDFLKKVQPERFRQVEYKERPTNVVGTKDRYHTFFYQRMAHDIPFPENGIQVVVDSLEQTIVQYNLNWTSAKLPSPEGILKQEEAHSAYLQSYPLELRYLSTFTALAQQRLFLVYEPKGSTQRPFSEIIDAKTGKPLDWQGKEIEEPFDGNFKDIKGHIAEKEIRQLGKAGIFTDYGDEFKPDEALSVASLLQALEKVKNPYRYEGLANDEELLKGAQKRGLLGDEVTLTDQVDREIMTRAMIDLLSLQKIAQLEQIFQVPFGDQDTFPTNFKGYAALAWGLGLPVWDEQVYGPSEVVTRAEGAMMLMDTLETRQKM